MKQLITRFLRKIMLAGAAAAALAVPAASQADEFRALWVDAFGSGFLNATEVSKLVNDCQTYNFNAVMVQIRRRGDAFYTPHAPNGDPKTTAIAANFDALQDLVNKCHASNPRIEVHCWVAANLIWSDTTKSPSQPGHVFNLHPEYLNRTSGGNTQFAEGYFLDPGHPDAMSWNYNMAKDIVSHYDIDGFHWDYIRYPQQDAGYSPVAIARYNAEFGLTGTPSVSSSQFSNWRRRQVTDFVRWVNADLLEIKPSLMISAAVFGDRNDAKNFRFQDWGAWNNEGILDVAMPMNYSADNNSIFLPRFNDAVTNQGVRAVYMGLGAYLNNAANTVTQLNTVRSKLNGSVLFSYRTPNSGTVNQAATFQYIKDNYQPTWEPTPALPWVANPTKAIIKGTITRADNGDAIYNANIQLNGATRTQKTEPHGKYVFFEVTPGTYNITASALGFTNSSASVNAVAGGIYNLDLTIDLPAIVDETAPIISSVRAGTVTSNSCVITWTTDEASDSTVEFGADSQFDASTTSANKVTSHSVTLTDLTPGTSYQYRVKSADAAGNETVSAVFQFTTIPAQSDIIVDNVNAKVVGPWTVGTSSTDKFSTNYLTRGRGTGANFVEFIPSIGTPGNYQVFEWHTAGSNRASNAPVTIKSLAGAQTYFVNQQANGGKWNYIGTFYFNAGTNGSAKISDAFADAAVGRVVGADAVRFTFLPEQSVPDIIVDNPAAAFTGSWSTTSSAADKFGVDYRFRSRGTGANFATFAPLIPVAGDYQLYEWHSQGSNRGTDVPHIVASSISTQTVKVNQQKNGGKWNLIGTFGFNQGTAGTIKITDGFATPTNGVVMADAIRLAYVAPPAPPTPPSDLLAEAVSASQIDLTWSASSSGLNFIVGRSETAGGPYTDIATVSADTLSFSDTGLLPNTSYFYVVRAVGVGGPSSNSSESSATTLPLAPTAPTGLTATASSSSQIDLSWTDGETQDAVFIVSRSLTAGGTFTDIASLESRFTTYSDAGLTASTAYYYKVRAHNAGGDSAESNIASATTLSAVPAAPSNLNAVATAPNQVELTWTDNASNDESTAVLRSTENGTYTVIASLPADANNYVDNTVQGHTRYFYYLRVANVAGNTLSEAVQVVTPNSNPVANAGTEISVAADENCQATVTLDASASTDADGDPLLCTWTGAFGTVQGTTPSVTLPLGTHVVTLTVNDGQGGISSASVTVTVFDNTAPLLTLNGSSAVTVECHDSFIDSGATASDACAGDLSALVLVSGTVDTNTPGVYTLTYAVSDNSGNTTTVTRTVTVVDTTAPALALNGLDPMIVECHSQFNDPGATATDVCAGDLASAIVVSGSVDANAPGSYVITYSVTDPSGNAATVTRTVNVVDTTAPALALNGAASVTVECHSSFNDEGATATDICAGDLTSTIVVSGSVDVNSPGIYTVSYTVSDASGNAATATRTVNVVDRTPPALTLNGAAAMVLTAHQTFVDPGAVATDICAGDLSGSVIVSGSVNPNVLGSYTLTYSVTDASGNTATAIRTVNVIDTSAPTLSLNGAATMTIECHSGFVDPGATASDDYAGDLTSAIVVSGSVDANSPGLYTVTYSVTDPSGNSASAVRTVQVIDTTAPLLTLNGAAAITIEAFAPFTDPGAVATDACAGDLTSAITVSGTVNNAVPGVYVLTYSVSDSSGNPTTATRTVSVVDRTAPVISTLDASATVLWPVNHEMVAITLSASVSDAVDTAPVTKIISITSNEAVNGLGDGNTSVDWQVTDLMALKLRAERSGKLGDRIYTITVESADASGNKATKTINVVVPHDQRASN